MLPKSVQGKGALGARCDYIGSSTNLVSLETILINLDSNYSRDGVGRHYEYPVVGCKTTRNGLFKIENANICFMSLCEGFNYSVVSNRYGWDGR